MKKLPLGALLILITGISVYSWWERSLVTPEQEVALQSLTNRYIEAFCENPTELAAILLENTTISPALISRSVDYLEQLLVKEGSCYGHSKNKVRYDLHASIHDVARDLVRMGMTTEWGVSDFSDCLVGIERSFIDLSDASRRVFECMELLDVRGFWYNVLVYQPQQYYPPVDYVPAYPAEPIDVITTPVGPEVPVVAPPAYQDDVPALPQP